jgi:hypothetical protein
MSYRQQLPSEFPVELNLGIRLRRRFQPTFTLTTVYILSLQFHLQGKFLLGRTSLQMQLTSKVKSTRNRVQSIEAQL